MRSKPYTSVLVDQVVYDMKMSVLIDALRNMNRFLLTIILYEQQKYILSMKMDFFNIKHLHIILPFINCKEW